MSAARYDELLRLAIPDAHQTYTRRDTMFYALSLGMGKNPCAPDQLSFVYEKHLKSLPTMGVVLAHPGFWVRDLDTKLDWVKVVHAEQGLILHRPLPCEGRIIGRSRIVDIVDKGPDKGALLYYERKIFDASNDDLLCTVTQTVFCRGDGGIGGPNPARSAAAPPPDRPPDVISDTKTDPRIALLYRLNGDFNPLHADPAVANSAGFERPILHGLATYGVAGIEVMNAICPGVPDRIKEISARFSSPVFPGETLRTQIWQDNNRLQFNVSAVERGTLVLTNGVALVGFA